MKRTKITISNAGVFMRFRAAKRCNVASDPIFFDFATLLHTARLEGGGR